MSDDDLQISFFGRTADYGELDLYDAGRSLVGLSRTLAVLGEYYRSGRIIVQAPTAQAEINLRAPRKGSFTLDVAANLTATLISVPFVVYLTYLFGQWLPGGKADQDAKIERLRRRLEVQEAKSDSLEQALRQRDSMDSIATDVAAVREFLASRQTEHDVLRSIVASSFVQIFRPIGRSADVAIVTGSRPGTYIGAVDRESVAQLETEVADAGLSEVVATVTAFSRSSKRGTAMSSELGRGFRFHYGALGKLGKEDDFSWSQYRQRDLKMTGRYYKFFDGKIKHFEVVAVERTSTDE